MDLIGELFKKDDEFYYFYFLRFIFFGISILIQVLYVILAINFFILMEKADNEEDLQNKICDYIEIQKGINGLIYDYLYPNHYQIKIIPNNKNNLEKYIYLKIQSDKALNNDFDLNNGIIDFPPNYPFPHHPFNKGDDDGGGDGEIILIK